MLEGSLSEFNFGEVLKLIAAQKKTGAIKLRDANGREGIVYVRDGDVYFAEGSWKRKPIGQRLVEAGKVTQEQVKEALDIQNKSGRAMRLGMILLDKGYITPQDLVSFVQEQILETVLEFFTWKDGTFTFVADKVAANEDIGIKMSFENLLLQGAERLENWKSLKKFIPDTSIVFVAVDAPADENKVIVLRPKELKVLRYIDGKRNVADLVKSTGMGEFELYRILFGLHVAGLIRKSEEVNDNKST